MSKESKKPDEVREKRVTYEDYAAMDDDCRYELADGKLELMSPGPTTVHQVLSFELQRAIHETCGEEFLILCAPLDVILSRYEVRQPDLVIIRKDRMDIVRMRGVEGVPDVVVEVLSPSTLRRDKLDKLKVYAKYGIPEYWVVEPETGVLEQHLLTGDRYELAAVYQGADPVSSLVLPCVQFTMAQIMDRIPKLRD
jgi:Uma2 family endonuclease